MNHKPKQGGRMIWLDQIRRPICLLCMSHFSVPTFGKHLLTLSCHFPFWQMRHTRGAGYPSDRWSTGLQLHQRCYQQWSRGRFFHFFLRLWNLSWVKDKTDLSSFMAVFVRTIWSVQYCTVPQMILNRKWSRDSKWSPKWTANDPRPQVIPKVAFSTVIVVSGRHDLPFDAQNISFDLFLIAVLFIAAK